MGFLSVVPRFAVPASWASQEEPDIDSSNDEDDPRTNPDVTAEGDPASDPGSR